jgi:hypothetical protein
MLRALPIAAVERAVSCRWTRQPRRGMACVRRVSHDTCTRYGTCSTRCTFLAVVPRRWTRRRRCGRHRTRSPRLCSSRLPAGQRTPPARASVSTRERVNARACQRASVSTRERVNARACQRARTHARDSCAVLCSACTYLRTWVLARISVRAPVCRRAVQLRDGRLSAHLLWKRERDSVSVPELPPQPFAPCEAVHSRTSAHARMHAPLREMSAWHAMQRDTSTAQHATNGMRNARSMPATHSMAACMRRVRAAAGLAAWDEAARQRQLTRRRPTGCGQ